MMQRRRVVRVPATSANLGPGYDVMAAALALTLEVEVAETGSFSVISDFGDQVPHDRENLVVAAFERLHPADDITFTIRSEIPLGRGLGSSAAAIVAGLVAADHLYELGNDHADLFKVAAEIEGHPDNVAAAIFGGFVVCDCNGGTARFDPPDGLESLAVIPEMPVSTNGARGSIPDQIPLGDAIANLGSVATLVLGLKEPDFALIGRGLRDHIHQDRRGHLYPRSLEVIEAAAESGAIGATISGAGPTVLVWTTWETSGLVAGQLADIASGWAEIRRVPFSPLGVQVPEL